MPRTMRRTALRSAYAAKIAQGVVTAIDRLTLAEPKTKLLASTLGKLGAGAGQTLLIVGERSTALVQAARNIPWLEVETPTHASAYQVVRCDRLVIERGALASLEESLK
jgi:large subunit ribosomal protein L4